MQLKPRRQEWLLTKAAVFGVITFFSLAGCAPIANGTDTTVAEVGECSPGFRYLERTFNSGSSWSLCWSDEPQVGLSLSQVIFTTAAGERHRIIANASLGQIHVPYDDGEHGQLDMPAFGAHTAELSKKNCASGIVENDERPLLCASVIGDHLRQAWVDDSFDTGNHSTNGQCLDLYTMTPVDWYTYLNRWDLCDDGSVRPSVGAGGKLAPEFFGDDSNSEALGDGDQDKHLSHFHNVFWRIQFDLDSPESLTLKDISYSNVGSRFTTSETIIDRESASVANKGHGWRVESKNEVNADGHAFAYDIELVNANPYRDVPGAEFTNNDLYVTDLNPCEKLAAGNVASNCGDSLIDYIDDEPLNAPVFWLQTSFHHIPRDEDEPVMDEHWQGFSMTPRSMSTDNSLVGKSR